MPPPRTRKSPFNLDSSEKRALMKSHKRRRLVKTASLQATASPPPSQKIPSEQPASPPAISEIHPEDQLVNVEDITTEDEPLTKRPRRTHPAEPSTNPPQSTLTIPSTETPASSTHPEDEPSPTTMWPEGPAREFPFEVLDSFIFPQDEQRFKDTSSHDLVAEYARHQCQGNAMLARILPRLSGLDIKEKQMLFEIECLRADIRGLEKDLIKEKDQHADTRNQHTRSKRQVEELQQHITAIREERDELIQLRDSLTQEHNRLINRDAEQKATIQHLQQRVSTMHSQMMELAKAGELLQKEHDELKQQGPPMTEAAKQKVIEEYEESPALIEKIVSEFSKGYMDHKEKIRAKMTTAGVDTKILDSSDDESEAEEDVLPPTN